MIDLHDFLDDTLMEKYEFYNMGHAVEILSLACKEEWEEIKDCLRAIEITMDDIKKPGGNESPIPDKFNCFLHPLGWKEIQISGQLDVKVIPRRKDSSKKIEEEHVILTNYIDGHNIDFVKNKVAFDLEWNSKDQTFDRDLLAMRTYFDCGIVDVGIIVTRAEELNDIFKSIPYGKEGKTLMKKYGASTTWMGKLKYRLESRRNGGCPILAVGIKKACVVDWEEK